MVDMAVGIIIGAAFGTVVKSLVDDVIMPPIGLLAGRVDFSQLFLILKNGTPPGPYATAADAAKAGAVALRYGMFINDVVAFLIIALSVFLLVKALNRLKRKEEGKPVPQGKQCPYCMSSIPAGAVRCPQCTSTLGE